MKVKMIGTGAILVKERSACYLVDDRILVDCGNGTIKTLLGYDDVDVSKINTLLITHLHGDHFLDIPFLILLRNSYKLTDEFRIYCPVGTTEIIGKLIGLAFPDIKDWTEKKDKANVKFIEFENLSNEEVIPGYLVDSYNVSHGDIKPSYGYTIKNNESIIGFSGDSSYCNAIDEIVEKSNLIILDTSKEFGNDQHMGIDNIKTILEKYNKRTVASHLSKKVREILDSTNIENLIVANDGEEYYI